MELQGKNYGNRGYIPKDIFQNLPARFARLIITILKKDNYKKPSKKFARRFIYYLKKWNTMEKLWK